MGAFLDGSLHAKRLLEPFDGGSTSRGATTVSGVGLTKRLLEERQGRGWASRDGFVCTNCVLDYALRAVIGSNLVEDTCDFCGQTSGAPIAAEVDVVIGAVAEGIRSEYEDRPTTSSTTRPRAATSGRSFQ